MSTSDTDGPFDFDPDAKLSARDAKDLTDLLSQVGTVGLVNGDRTGPRSQRRSTTSNEAYCARRLVLWLVETGRVTFPLSISHADCPDFTIEHPAGAYGLEVTEASPAAEGKKYAKQTSVEFVGDYDRLGSDVARREFCSQVQAAIDRKSRKPYADRKNSMLLIYPVSEASLWVRLFDRHIPEEMHQLKTGSFESVFLLWGGSVVELDCEGTNHG